MITRSPTQIKRHPRTVHHGLAISLKSRTVRPSFSLSFSLLAHSKYLREMALNVALVLLRYRCELRAGFYLSILDVNCTTYNDNECGNIETAAISTEETCKTKIKEGLTLFSILQFDLFSYLFRKGCVISINKGQSSVCKSTTIYFHLANTKDCVTVRRT
jgi:hypothetical protein